MTAKMSSAVTMNRACLSCSGQRDNTISLFKSACLKYKPSQVRFEQENYGREELINMQRQLSFNLNASLAFNRRITGNVQNLSDGTQQLVNPIKVRQINTTNSDEFLSTDMNTVVNDVHLAATHQNASVQKDNNNKIRNLRTPLESTKKQRLGARSLSNFNKIRPQTSGPRNVSSDDIAL